MVGHVQVLGGVRKSSETNTQTGTCLRRYISALIIKAYLLLSGSLTSHMPHGYVMKIPPFLIISDIKGILYYRNSLYKNFPKQSNSSTCFYYFLKRKNHCSFNKYSFFNSICSDQSSIRTLADATWGPGSGAAATSLQAPSRDPLVSGRLGPGFWPHYHWHFYIHFQDFLGWMQTWIA